MRQRLDELFGEHGERPGLDQRVEGVDLSGVEPHRIEEEPPGHPSRPRPDQVEGDSNEEDADKGISEQDEPGSKGERSERSSETDGVCWAAVPGNDAERDPGARADILQAAQPAEHCNKAHTVRAQRVGAAHAPEVEAVAMEEAGLGSRRFARIRERGDGVEDPPVVVSGEPEGGEWRRHLVERGHNDCEGPSREDD